LADNVKQNAEYVLKASWVVAYRAMVAAKAQSAAADAADTAAKQAVTDAKKIFDELTISKAEADTHAGAEKVTYDANLLLKTNKKKEWDCYALSISHKATAVAAVGGGDATKTCKLAAGGAAVDMTSTTGNCRRAAYTDEVGRATAANPTNPAPNSNIYFKKYDTALAKARDTTKITDTACKAACILDDKCVAADVTATALTKAANGIDQVAGCVLYYKDPEWNYKGDT